MSVSPAQNFSKPPPVPEVPTVTLTSGFSAWNCSATASVSGATVLEPSMRIDAGEVSAAAAAALVVVVAAAGRDAEREDGRGGEDREPPRACHSVSFVVCSLECRPAGRSAAHPLSGLLASLLRGCGRGCEKDVKGAQAHRARSGSRCPCGCG